MPMLGEAMALACALTWAISVVLFKRAEAIGPHAMNLFKNVVGATLLVATLPLLGEGIDWERPAEHWARLALSGVLGIAVADTLFFVALARIGASVLAVVEFVYTPVVVGLAAVTLGERPTWAFGAGALLVLGGVALVSVDRRALAEAHTRGIPLVGVAIGAFGVSLTAFGVVIAKPALEHAHLVEATLVRLVFGVVAHTTFLALRGRLCGVAHVFAEGQTWRRLAPAAVLGTYVSMLLWLGGFKHADASVAGVLNQMSTVFILLLAWRVLGEPMTARKASGTALAAAGTALILVLAAPPG